MPKAVMPVSISHLPSEVLEEIFSQLTINQLLQCKTVCRHFEREIAKQTRHIQHIKCDIDEKRAKLEKNASDLCYCDCLRTTLPLVAVLAMPIISSPFITEIPFQHHLTLQFAWGVAVLVEIIALDILFVINCCPNSAELQEEKKLRDIGVWLENDITVTLQTKLRKTIRSHQPSS